MTAPTDPRSDQELALDAVQIVGVLAGHLYGGEMSPGAESAIANVRELVRRFLAFGTRRTNSEEIISIVSDAIRNGRLRFSLRDGAGDRDA